MKREIEGIGEVEVQEDFAQVAADVKLGRNIQETLVGMFSERTTWTPDEVYAIIKIAYPWSTYKPSRAVADVRKFNKGIFTCQDGVRPERPVKLLGSVGGRTRGVAADAAERLAAL